jgi:zinc ribbon protein
MFCSHCGAENPEDAKFCSSCGQPQAVKTTESTPQQREPAPPPQYSQFIFRLLLSLFLLSAAVFDCWQLAMLRVGGANFVRPLVIGLVAIYVLSAAKSSWMVILSQEPTSDNEMRTKHKRTIRYAVVTGILLFSCAVLFGWLIGKSRRQLQALDRDLSEYADLNHRISKARNNPGKTIPDFVQTYASIENDVITLNNNASRLKNELTEYDNDFPEFHAQTQKSIQNVVTTQLHMNLLLKEIGVAKQLKSTEASEQDSLWTSEMLPLFDQEDQLDAKTAVH